MEVRETSDGSYNSRCAVARRPSGRRVGSFDQIPFHEHCLISFSAFWRKNLRTIFFGPVFFVSTARPGRQKGSFSALWRNLHAWPPLQLVGLRHGAPDAASWPARHRGLWRVPNENVPMSSSRPSAARLAPSSICGRRRCAETVVLGPARTERPDKQPLHKRIPWPW